MASKIIRYNRYFTFNPSHTPIIRIGGQRINQLPSPLLSLIQVDGSYRPKTKTSAVAYYMKTINGTVLSQAIPIKAGSSTEAEWAAIYFGLKAALDNNYKDLHIQNDCLSIIQAFLPHASRPCLEYARHFKNEITSLADSAEWVGISWIPRELNRADEILQ